MAIFFIIILVGIASYIVGHWIGFSHGENDYQLRQVEARVMSNSRGKENGKRD
jgi:hypothetical protein